MANYSVVVNVSQYKIIKVLCKYYENAQKEVYRSYRHVDFYL